MPNRDIIVICQEELEDSAYEVVYGEFGEVLHIYNSPEEALADLEIVKPDMVLVHRPIAQQDLTKLQRAFKDTKIFTGIATLRALLQ